MKTHAVVHLGCGAEDVHKFGSQITFLSHLPWQKLLL